MGIKFEFLKAFNGDSIFITTDEGTNILIDGGLDKTYSIEIKPKIEKIIKNKKFLDLVVLTHYDDDHIGGLLKLLEDEIKNLQDRKESIIKEFWFNSFDEALVSPINYSNNTSARQQIKFDDYIRELVPYINYRASISIDKIQNVFLGNNKEIKITLLSPNNKKLDKLFKDYKKKTKSYETSASSNDYNKSIEELSQKKFKKDTSLPNGASIAFILEYENKKFLFLGDAHIDLIIDSLRDLGYSKEKRLKVEFVKLSHHGSSKNLNSEFLDLIECEKFVILTNGGRHQHPNKEALSRVILSSNRDKNKRLKFICNYENIVMDNPFSYEEEEEYNFELVYMNKLQVGSKDEK